jgi:hypothetical protein
MLKEGTFAPPGQRCATPAQCHPRPGQSVAAAGVVEEDGRLVLD